MADIRYGHYTTTAGLLGIVKEELLWATNIKFLNDEHEFVHALEMIKDIIAKQKIPMPERVRPTFEEYIVEVKEQLESLDNYRAETVFTLSFSEQIDLLSQWRGYCPNNNGYCIVFDAQKLYEAVGLEFDDVHLVKCVYDEKQKTTQIKQLLNEFWNKYLKLELGKERKALIEELSKDFVLFASYFKHPSFAEEKEHRIVIFLKYSTNNDIKFREGRSSLVPYIQLPASRKLIQKICIGPNASKALARRALEAFLETTFAMPSFVSDVDIEFSATPYRPTT